jgi:hypothetical protein
MTALSLVRRTEWCWCVCSSALEERRLRRQACLSSFLMRSAVGAAVQQVSA